MDIIKVNDITKNFNGFTAVNRVSFNISEGEIFGILGPNGAGKTTIISMLSTILRPTSGSGKVMGFDIKKERDNVRKTIGIVFQDTSLDDQLTGRENLDFHGRLYGVPSKKRESRIKEVLKLVDLEDKADNIVKGYSGGMKRRLEIARGLIHHPKILFLDEPTLGLDPQTRRRLWEYIKQLNKNEKMTIIITTHYMEEADFLCNRIAIIDHGKIIALNKPEKLKEVLGGDLIILDVTESERLAKYIRKEKYVKGIKLFDRKINITVSNGNKLIPKIIEFAKKRKIEVNSVMLKQPSLEDVFIHYTGRTIREEIPDGKAIMKQRMRMRGH